MNEPTRSALVTGAAGFIGSHISERLLQAGWEVRGVDCYTDYYARPLKEANIEDMRGRANFEFIEKNVLELQAADQLCDVDVVFHQAAQAGVRDSWGEGFGSYVHHNVLATQHLLEESRKSQVQRFIYASSSSVYGKAVRYPTHELDLTRPYSPYGVTKLAAENLVGAYARNFGLPTVSLRYHTVYGPRQRPDMAIFRLIDAALKGGSFGLYAAADFVRDFTYVDDICDANLKASELDLAPGTTLNLAGGESISMRGLIAKVSELTGRPLLVEDRPGQPGDVERTGADWAAARQLLGWSPKTTLDQGLVQQIAWQRRSSD